MCENCPVHSSQSETLFHSRNVARKDFRCLFFIVAKGNNREAQGSRTTLLWVIRGRVGRAWEVTGFGD